MQVNLLKEVVSSVAGVNSVGIVNLLYGKKNVNEFIIAKKLGLNINQTRNILYKLVDVGLVSFVRKKDKKNGGWYTYYWTLDTGKALVFLKNALSGEIKNLEEQLLTRNKATFYYCPNCDAEFNEEAALLNNFTCPECGEVLELLNPGEIIKKLEASIAKKREQLALVDTEVTDVNQKVAVVKKRKFAREVKKKKLARALKKKATAKLKIKAKKLSGNKKK